MNIYELEAKCVEINESEKDFRAAENKKFDLFDSSFKVEKIASNEMLAIIRDADEKCLKEVNGSYYVDKSYRELMLVTSFMVRCTDLDFSNPNAGNSVVNTYDAIMEIGLKDYFYKRQAPTIKRFSRFCKLEEENLKTRLALGWRPAIKEEADDDLEQEEGEKE